MFEVTVVVVTEVEPTSSRRRDFCHGDVIAEIDERHRRHGRLRSRNGRAPRRPDVLFKVARHSDSDRVLTLVLAGTVPTVSRSKKSRAIERGPAIVAPWLLGLCRNDSQRRRPAGSSQLNLISWERYSPDWSTPL